MPMFQLLAGKLKPQIERFPRLSAFYRALRDQLDTEDESLITEWGFHLAGNAMMAQGQFEPMQTRIVRDILVDSDLLINVGANVGYYCCHALSLGKPVIAFEPLQRNLRYLYRNIRSNGWANAEIFPLALSDRGGILEFFGGDTGASLIRGWAGISINHKTLVPCSTLDSVMCDRLRGKKALIIIDVEGAEDAVIAGGSRILAGAPKPTWILEICFDEHHPGGVNPKFKTTFERFWGAGYASFSIEAGMRPVTPTDVERWLNSQKRDFGYVTYLFRAHD